jgi:hypothetical protein
MNEPTQATAQLQAAVEYMAGITVASASPALLEWTADNRLRLFKMDFDKNQATEVLLDVPVNEIEKVGGSMTGLVFHHGGKKYTAMFTTTAAAKMGVGGAVGLAAALQDTNASGINLWIKKFQEAGVRVTVIGWGKTVLIALGLVVVLFGVFVVLYATGIID